jgi:erythromycin esterase-like protein
VGLDLYSLHHSIEVVLEYLRQVDPTAAAQAREYYACFDHFGKELQSYGYWIALEPSRACTQKVLAQLNDLRKRELLYTSSNNASYSDFFNAAQNARLVKNAEHYYQSLFGNNSWNVRDQHMMETLFEVEKYLHYYKRPEKIVVWAHNSHLGDARATEMNARGEINLGQLVREHFGDDAFSIGFSTASGTVSAASDWGSEVERKHVRYPLHDSYEDLFHQTKLNNFWFFTDDAKLPEEWHQQERLQRAIGVIYRPQTERMSHYFYALLPQQFDVMIHLDKTQALTPLELSSAWIEGELPDTYPSGE